MRQITIEINEPSVRMPNQKNMKKRLFSENEHESRESHYGFKSASFQEKKLFYTLPLQIKSCLDVTFRHHPVARG